MSDTFTLPTIITSAGLQVDTPADILAQLINYVSINAPGYTVLPGVLMEDLTSTEVAGIVQIDQLRVEMFNSLTPYGANAFTLNQQGVQMGVLPGAETNTSVYVVFSGTVGFPISPGFTVGDGTYQYVVQDPGIIETGGSSQPLFAVATQPGTWAVPANSVTAVLSAVPVSYTVTVTNPQDGIPGAAAETEQAYRARVFQAQQAPAQGMPSYMKSQLAQVTNVQARLVSVVQGTGGFKVICGGGDQYAVANAIFASDFDISRLVGSVMDVTSISNAANAVVSLNLNHGYSNGQTATINGVVGMTGVNGVPFVVTAYGYAPNQFECTLNTSGSGTYVSGGVLTPNLRNLTPNVYDYPDTYTIPFVNPPSQEAAVAVTWNTIATNYVSNDAMTQAVVPAFINYIQSIPVGQPINQFELIAVFQQATAALVPTALLTRLVFAYTIDGVEVSPESGTGIVAGDPESYFFSLTTDITVTQG